VEDRSDQTNVFDGISTTIGNFSNSQRVLVVNRLAERFWRRLPTPTESAVVLATVDEVGSGLGQSSGSAMRLLLTVTCTVIGSTIESLSLL